MGKTLDLADGAAWAGEEAQEELRLLRQSEREGWRYADELEQERKRLEAQLAKPDCGTCANRWQVDGLSQETHCEHCQWQEQWRTDHYAPNALAQGREPLAGEASPVAMGSAAADPEKGA